VRAWKEIVIAVLFFLVVIGFFLTKKRKLLFTTHRRLLLFAALIVGGILLTLLMHVLHIDEPITRRAMAMRYDYLGFVLLALGWSATLFLDKELPEKLLLRYGRVIKWVLVAALIWWCIVAIKPGTLKPL
jgi:hypothetical protein